MANSPRYENRLRLYLIPRREREKRIGDALAMMGLTEMRDRLVRHYPGGMIRRLKIAQSTLHRPAIIFMDEPTIGSIRAAAPSASPKTSRPHPQVRRGLLTSNRPYATAHLAHGSDINRLIAWRHRTTPSNVALLRDS